MLPLDRDAPATEVVGGCGAAVVMLHDYERGLVQVQALLAAGVAYVGVLGPWRRSPE